MPVSTWAIHKRLIAFLLATAYFVAFVLSPYWNLPSSTFAKSAILAGILGVGAAWVYLSAGSLSLRVSRQGIAYGLMLAALMLAINFKALTGSIAWRGDESSHVIRIQLLAAKIPEPSFLLGLCYLLLVLVLAWWNWKWAAALGGIGILGAVLFVATSIEFRPTQIEWILHYPFVNYWLDMLPVRLAAPFAGIFHEILYRLIPFASMAGTAWLLQREISERHRVIDLLWGLAAATIPLVIYYSSVLYLEPPAVFLMVMVCLRSRQLLDAEAGEIRREPGWYALILIGFVRDTALLFLLCFTACRLGYQVWQARKQTAKPDWRGLGAAEARLAFAIFAPCTLYLVLRNTLTIPERSYVLTWSVLANPSVYRAVAQSFVEQFGAWLLLFGWGAVLLWQRREYAKLFFLLMVAIVYPVFHAMDSGGVFAGYSRFNLFAAPALLAGAAVAVKEIRDHSRVAAILAACVLLGINLIMSPLHLDGSRIPLWGNYLSDTSEHSYPYQDALSWLEQNAGKRRILFTGMDYAYDFDFYFQQLNWQPRRTIEIVSYVSAPGDDFRMEFQGLDWHPARQLDRLWATGTVLSEGDRLTQMLRFASQGGYSIVVYHVLGAEVPQAVDMSGFELQKVFLNQAHVLAVYFRNPK